MWSLPLGCAVAYTCPFRDRRDLINILFITVIHLRNCSPSNTVRYFPLTSILRVSHTYNSTKWESLNTKRSNDIGLQEFIYLLTSNLTIFTFPRSRKCGKSLMISHHLLLLQLLVLLTVINLASLDTITKYSTINWIARACSLAYLLTLKWFFYRTTD